LAYERLASTIDRWIQAEPRGLEMTSRRRQGAVLLAGAAVTYVLLGPAGLGFHWTPLVIGLAYLAAALAGGRRGSYWSTAVVLSVFGLGPVAIFALEVDVTQAAAYTVCLGLAVLLAAQLAERGWAISATAVGAVILALGVVYALQPEVELVEEPAVYAVALAVVGALRLARA